MNSANGSTGSAAGAKRVLVVEDELMIRMLLEDMLEQLGYTIAAEAGRIDEALDAAKTGEFDLAILDVNLNGQTSGPVARSTVTADSNSISSGVMMPSVPRPALPRRAAFRSPC